MSRLVARVREFSNKLREHKKKTIFLGFIGYLGSEWLVNWNRNRKIRTVYAQKAAKYGEQKLSPDDRSRRVFVLVNVEGNGRKCFDDFVKNAKPLFHLAGLQVDIVKADTQRQLELLAGAVDSQEADALFIVGGDGTIGTVLSGIFRNRKNAALPIGIYPGGYDNLTIKRLVPTVFDNSSDVRAACESAMALIEERRTKLATFEFQIEGRDTPPEYGIGDVGLGWFRHIEDVRRKFWYFGFARRRWAYVWEMIKRSPEEFTAEFDYEEPCSGCNNCRKNTSAQTPQQFRWWHFITGLPRYNKHNDQEKDFSNIVNENCGKLHTSSFRGTDFLLEGVPSEDRSILRLRVGGADFGRFGVVADGWKRCLTGQVAVSPSSSFYSTDLIAQAYSISFKSLPAFINTMYVSSNKAPEDDLTNRKVQVRATSRTIDVFLPSKVIDLQEL